MFIFAEQIIHNRQTTAFKCTTKEEQILLTNSEATTHQDIITGLSAKGRREMSNREEIDGDRVLLSR